MRRDGRSNAWKTRCSHSPRQRGAWTRWKKRSLHLDTWWLGLPPVQMVGKQLACHRQCCRQLGFGKRTTVAQNSELRWRLLESDFRRRDLSGVLRQRTMRTTVSQRQRAIRGVPRSNHLSCLRGRESPHPWQLTLRRSTKKSFSILADSGSAGAASGRTQTRHALWFGARVRSSRT